MSTHTPGPWEAGRDAERTGHVIRATAHGGAEVGLFVAGGPPLTGQGFANARLIAAAPALLEALEQYVCAETDPDCTCGGERAGRDCLPTCA
ncbi:MAG: hypothetical protein V3W06_09100, partial [Acidimicrobiia bacterium]